VLFASFFPDCPIAQSVHNKIQNLGVGIIHLFVKKIDWAKKKKKKSKPYF
jgi:hypothetical protein